ncbi:MAG: DUF979 domain-containing protein [Hyphomonadaceae bacterium]
MIALPHLYILAGLVFGAFAVLSVIDGTNPRRFGTAAFWGLVAASFLFGSLIGDLGNGLVALGLVVLAAFGLGQGKAKTTTTEERRSSAERRGNLLFLPALVIPAVALLGTLAAQNTAIGAAIMDPKQATLISLILGVLVALAIIMIWLKPPLLAPLQEGRRLIDAVGWAVILPQMLASLGAVFLAAGVGDQVGKLFADYIPLDTRLAAVAAYCIGMALFTILMGNAFAAFPVMTAAVGLPVVIHGFGGDPAVVCAIGMLAGFCGTLMTPMAANFNVVPANLLDLPDRNAALNGVIRAQIPTALPMLGVNIVLMYLLAFHA